MLYLHIGTQKTGSSTVQHFLRSNRKALLRQGYNFVRAVREWNDHNRLARELRGGSEDLPRLQAVTAEIREGAQPHHIVSAEELFHARAARRLGQFLAPDILANTRVIVYLRRPDDLMEALYKQRVKTGEINPWPMDYLQKSAFEVGYRAVLDAYAEVFGRERMVVRPYRRDLLKNDDIVDDFMGVLGLDDLTGLPRDMPEDNPTFSAAVSELMGVWVKTTGNSHVRLNEVIAAQNFPMSRRSGDVYTSEQRAELLASLADDLQAICDTYGRDLAPVFEAPDFADMGAKGFPTWREWSDLHKHAGQAVLRAVVAMQKNG